jgi:hypothetical protein
MKPLYALLTFSFMASHIYSQDSCLEALAIEAGIFEITVIDGTEIPDPICAQNGLGNTDRSEWYAYTPIDTVMATIYTSFPQNAGVDNRVHVYTGECGTLECVTGDDDSGAGLLCHASWIALEGVTYYIVFDNRWSSFGFDFELIEEIENVVIPEFGFTSMTTPFMTRTLGIVDMNGDFLDDILDVSSTAVFTLLQNEEIGYIYTAVPTPPATYPYSWSIAAGDLDGNGYNDLLYGSGQGVSFMYRNDNGLGFEHWTSGNYVFSQRSNFVDLNNDGNLDAFVCHDVQPNVYYTNDGEGNLSFAQGGMSDVPDGGNYGSIFVDYNNDGLQDLFIAKCRGGASLANYNQLFRNNGDGTFTEVSEAAGVYDPLQTWSSAWGDFDNDGWIDLLVGASSFSQGGHKLMINNGDGTFSDVTAASGFDELPSTGIEWVSYDFDNDGYIDVLGGNGVFMMNNGDMTFSPIVFSNVTNGPIGDFNNDGFLDIGNQTNLHLNEGNDNNWMKINTLGTTSNINGIGARVTLYTPAGKQIRDVQSGVGFRYMNTLNVHFGMGEESTVDSLVVHWPSGWVDSYYDLQINSFHILTEGETEEEVGEPVSSTDEETSTWSLYPNPARELLEIMTDVQPVNGNITVFDLQGRLVLQQRFAHQLDITVLNPGTYLLKVTSDLHQATFKFVKTY